MNKYIIVILFLLMFLLTFCRKPLFLDITELTPEIESFTSDFPVILTQGHERDNTALVIDIDFPVHRLLSFDYEIIWGGGTLSGEDSANGKVYNAGSTTGLAEIRTTVENIGGNSSEETLNILVLNEGHQKISSSEGNFSGILDDSDFFGNSLCNIGDIDGDGIPEMAVGTVNDDDGGTDKGAVWILFLNQDNTVRREQKISEMEGNFYGELNDSDAFGSSVAGIGDLDGDNIPDLAIGALNDDDGGINRGAVWILFLNPDGTVKTYQKISNTEGGFTGGLVDADWFGSSVASLGDLNNDGTTDIAAGSQNDSENGIFKGAVWILFLNANGTVKMHQKINDTQVNFSGTLNDFDNFGFSVNAIGDLNGDNIVDIAVGAFMDSEAESFSYRGAVWILFLNTDGTVQSHQKINDVQGNFTGTLIDQDFFGSSVCPIGDMNNDTIPDIAVGATGDANGGSDRGAVWILFLNSDGTVQSHRKINETEGYLTGIFGDNYYFGASVALIKSNTESITLAVGANGDSDGGTQRGAAWILHLNQDGTVLH